MNMLSDPSMKEVVDDFCTESETLLNQLQDVLDDMEDGPENSANFEKFGQIIDRIMGAAATLQADQISKFAELGKAIGYKSSQVDDIDLRNIVTAILFDTVDLFQKIITGIKTGDSESLETLNTDAFVSRLQWLKEKFKNVERASVEMGGGEKVSNDDIDENTNNIFSGTPFKTDNFWENVTF